MFSNSLQEANALVHSLNGTVRSNVIKRMKAEKLSMDVWGLRFSETR